MAVHELLRLTPRVRTALLSHASSDFLRQVARASGMRTMFEDGERKVALGLTTMDELLRNVPPPEHDDSEDIYVPDRRQGGGPMPAPQVPAPVPRDAVPSAARRPRVLIVDSDTAHAGHVAEALEQEHYDVLRASSPAEALPMVFRESPDVVVAEAGGAAPAAGIDFLRKLRQNLATVALPVVLVTANDEVETELQALDAGADDFLRRSASPAVLLSRIRRILLRVHLAHAAG
jgi:CheY-like chemotaxis protein